MDRIAQKNRRAARLARKTLDRHRRAAKRLGRVFHRLERHAR